jgi:hypothetical protein
MPRLQPHLRGGLLPRVGAALAGAAVVLVAVAAPALAHETRQVGAYQVAVGWSHEPTYAGVENGVQIFIHDAAGNPVDDLGTPTSLKVQVIYGSQTSPDLDLEPSWDPDTGLGTHGEWDAAITPTEPGVYTFHFTGSIDGQAVDEKFTSSDSTFDTVSDPTDIEFPTKTPTVGELATAQTRIQPRVTAAQQVASSARSSVSTATTLSIVALVVAVVLGGAALVLAFTRRRTS